MRTSTPDPLSKSCPNSSRKAAQDRWYAKLKSDPRRWDERLEKQRQRREQKEIREKERLQAREKWAHLPADHPRKKRKQQRKVETVKAYRKICLQRLPDAAVANRYLHLKVSECPEELLQIKREHIRLSRALRTKIRS